MCFLLESIEEMRKKVEALMSIKQQLTDLNSVVSNLTQKSVQSVNCQPAQGTTPKPLYVTAVSAGADREHSYRANRVLQYQKEQLEWHMTLI